MPFAFMTAQRQTSGCLRSVSTKPPTSAIAATSRVQRENSQDAATQAAFGPQGMFSKRFQQSSMVVRFILARSARQLVTAQKFLSRGNGDKRLRADFAATGHPVCPPPRGPSDPFPFGTTPQP